MVADTYNEVIKSLRAKYKKQALSAQEVADEIGVSAHTVRAGVKAGLNVPAFRVVGGGVKRKTVIFTLHDVAKYLANTQQVF